MRSRWETGTEATREKVVGMVEAAAITVVEAMAGGGEEGIIVRIILPGTMHIMVIMATSGTVAMEVMATQADATRMKGVVNMAVIVASRADVAIKAKSKVLSAE